MSIQRYDILHPKMRDKGRFVLYADHIADKDAELHNILSTLADVRAALGVGDKPMLSELAGVVRTRMGVIKILERDAEDNAAEVERLTAARDAAVLERDAAVEALKEVLATPSFGALHAVDAVDTIKMVRAALAKIEGGRG